MRERLGPAVLSLTLLLACVGTPAGSFLLAPVSAQQPAPAQPSALQARVDSLLDDPSAAAGTWGLEVRSLQTGETLAAVNPARLITPASTMKLVTLAVAAEQLGWDFAYETRVLANGTIANGTLEGDLVVVGSGDPSLDDWDGAATALFRRWADQLRARGITRIAGRVIGDDDLFEDGGLGAGWAWDDLAFGYSAPVSALQFNQNAAQIRVTPGPAAGTPAVVALSPPYADVRMDALVMTDAPATAPRLRVRPGMRDSRIEVGGVVPLRPSVVIQNVAVINPTLYYARAVREGLRASGIDVGGEAVDVDSLPERPNLDSAVTVILHRSPTLASLADTMMKMSQNLYAETLLRTVALAHSGLGTEEAGRALAREVADRWGVAPSELLVADASGLSRYNMATPRAFVTMLAYVYSDPRLRDAYLASLPVAARSGTLAQRMKGTTAEGLLRAKTGSMSNARGLAGYATTADNEPVAFAIFTNNYGVPGEAAQRIIDALVVAVVESSRPGRQ